MLDTGPVRRTRPESQRWLALALGGVALAALALGILTRDVLVDTDGDVSVTCGLRSCESCVQAACRQDTTLGLVHDIKTSGGSASAVWGWSGTIAFVAAIIAMVGLVIAMVIVGTRRFFRMPLISPTTLALLGGAVGLICGCIFLVTKPESVGVTHVGWTFWAFGAGAVTTIVSAFMLSRALADIEPDFDPGESPDQPAEEPWHEV